MIANPSSPNCSKPLVSYRFSSLCWYYTIKFSNQNLCCYKLRIPNFFYVFNCQTKGCADTNCECRISSKCSTVKLKPVLIQIANTEFLLHIQLSNQNMCCYKLRIPNFYYIFNCPTKICAATSYEYRIFYTCYTVKLKVELLQITSIEFLHIIKLSNTEFFCLKNGS